MGKDKGGGLSRAARKRKKRKLKAAKSKAGTESESKSKRQKTAAKQRDDQKSQAAAPRLRGTPVASKDEPSKLRGIVGPKGSPFAFEMSVLLFRVCGLPSTPPFSPHPKP